MTLRQLIKNQEVIKFIARIQNNISNILRIFKKFYNLYNKMIRTHNKEINKIIENY